MIQDIKVCPSCEAKPGEFHEQGCDVERCPRCKGQMITCDCIYEFYGISIDDMEETHPDIYNDGPTEDMYAKWDAEWDDKREPWSGEWPGVAECRELGFYCRDMALDGTPYTEENPLDYSSIKTKGIRFHVPCGKNDPGAHEDLNRLAMYHRDKMKKE